MGHNHRAQQAQPAQSLCGIWGNNKRLAYVDPTNTSTVFAHRCDDGHQHENLRADKEASAVGLAIGETSSGRGAASESFGECRSHPWHRERGRQFIWSVCCGRASSGRDDGVRREMAGLNGG
jgi:hypothetical protein